MTQYMVGWRSYFGFCETPEVLVYLTRWIRKRLRCALWRQWKTARRRTAALIQLGVSKALARNTAGALTARGASAGARPFPLSFPMPTSDRSAFLR